MKTEIHEPNDVRLRDLLRQARPAPLLPPRFEEGVWRRLEQSEAAPAHAALLPWLDALANRLWRPRLALAGAVAALALGGILGVIQGAADAREAASAAYVLAVAPNPVR